MTADTILRAPAQIADATTEQLLASYNALTGKSLTRFASRAAGERQLENAMLAAKDADGHLGVPRETTGQVKTLAELIAKATSKGLPLPDIDPEEAAPTFVLGSMADQLDKAARRAAPIVARAKKDPKAPAAPRTTLTHVRATGTGVSKVQSSSTRGEIFAFITAAPGGLASVAELDAQFKCNTKGYLQKLIEKAHIVPVDAQGTLLAAAPAAVE